MDKYICIIRLQFGQGEGTDVYINVCDELEQLGCEVGGKTGQPPPPETKDPSKVLWWGIISLTDHFPATYATIYPSYSSFSLSCRHNNRSANPAHRQAYGSSTLYLRLPLWMTVSLHPLRGPFESATCHFCLNKSLYAHTNALFYMNQIELQDDN